MTNSAFYVTLGFTAGAMLLSWLYFRRYQIKRPPIGTFNLLDIAFMTCAAILMHALYLHMPAWLVEGCFLPAR